LLYLLRLVTSTEMKLLVANCCFAPSLTWFKKTTLIPVLLVFWIPQISSFFPQWIRMASLKLGCVNFY
jgi:hypothetical protein